MSGYAKKALFQGKNLILVNCISLFFLIALTIYTFYDSYKSALEIWLVSEIFNHCLLVLPLSFYLIYRKKNSVLNQPIKPNYFVILILIFLLTIAAFSEIGQIGVISHLSAFTFIPISIISIIGLKAAKEIAFPLAFMLFAVPIGEELIPYLQQITADISVYLLKLSGTPVFRSGLFIDIPNGKFLVAEACSGISFLISSLAFGSLYAHLNFYSLRSKLLFTLVALIIPIFANAIRVYGIIMIAYYTDMKYAVGADHLIYGWFFYAFVLFCVFMIGERFRPKGKLPTPDYIRHESWKKTPIYKMTGLQVILLLSTSLWVSHVTNTSIQAQELIFVDSEKWEDSNNNLLNTSFNMPDVVFNKKVTDPSHNAYLLIATYYTGNQHEAISGNFVLFDKKFWSPTNTKNSIRVKDISLPVNSLSSVNGEILYYSHWYVVNGQPITSTIKAKLYETYLKLLNEHTYTNVIVLSWPDKGNNAANIKHYIDNSLVFLQKKSL